MQTKLRMGTLMFVASLLWTSPTSAATQQAKAKARTKNPKLHYVGTASWYGKQHQGRKMANGKPFDSRKITAASWYFPLGTRIRVVNLENSESLIVTITDRGPNLRLRRIVDLSEAAAAKLGYTQKGLAQVFIYPVLAVATEPADLDAALVEPASRASAPERYEARAFDVPQ